MCTTTLSAGTRHVSRVERGWIRGQSSGVFALFRASRDNHVRQRAATLRATRTFCDSQNGVAFVGVARNFVTKCLRRSWERAHLQRICIVDGSRCGFCKKNFLSKVKGFSEIEVRKSLLFSGRGMLSLDLHHICRVVMVRKRSAYLPWPMRLVGYVQ